MKYKNSLKLITKRLKNSKTVSTLPEIKKTKVDMDTDVNCTHRSVNRIMTQLMTVCGNPSPTVKLVSTIQFNED